MSFDNSRTRAELMQRIRAAQRRAAPTTSELAEADDYLARHPVGPQPKPVADLRAQFSAMAERMSSTVEAVDSMTQAPAAVARYLANQSIAPIVVAWPALAGLPWREAGVEVEFRAPRRDEPGRVDAVGITGSFCAIAETGTLVMLSSPESPASTHLLPETHIALVESPRIVATMEDAFELMRRERGGVDRMMPRAVNMVSGPSRTGDIEQTIVLGAHGPYRVHIVVAIGGGPG